MENYKNSKRFLIENEVEHMEFNKNQFFCISTFDNVTRNPSAIKVFLTIAKNKTRTYSELKVDTGLAYREVVDIVDEFEKMNFVKRNPNHASNKFKLAFNGQLFAEQLKMNYIGAKDFLGEKSLIEPLDN